MARRDVLHALSLGGSLFILWLLLSGYFEVLLLSLGVVSCILCVYVAHRMDVIDHEGHPIGITWRAIPYWMWLIVEIVKANIDVAKTILQPTMPLELRVLLIDGSQKSGMGHVIYANSITLTPGTVTIWLEGGQMEVHALTPASAAGLIEGEMDRRVCRVENPENV